MHIETDPMVPAPDSEAWWDVPVAEVSELDSTRRARAAYQAAKSGQRPFRRPAALTRGVLRPGTGELPARAAARRGAGRPAWPPHPPGTGWW